MRTRLNLIGLNLVPLAVLPVLAALPAPALAWDHLGWAVAPEDMPLRVTVEADVDVPGVREELVHADIQAALRRWTESSCGYSASFAGVAEYDSSDVPASDLHLTFAPLGIDAPYFVRLGQQPELEELYTRDGTTYQRAVPGAWVINTSRPLAADADIMGGTCDQARSLSSTVGLVVGVASGLAVSRDPRALMSGFFETCAIRAPADDDLAGLDALYGPWVEMQCVSEAGGSSGLEIPGVIPFDVVCEATPDPGSVLSDVRWTFGDGEDGTGNPIRHTYTWDDNFPVTVRALATHSMCGEREVEIRRENYIRACDAPKPDFRVERDRGLQFALLNTSDVRTWGCHSDVQWEVFDEAGELVADTTVWEPIVVLPEEGVYRVVLTLSGLAGSTTVEEAFDTRDSNVRGYTLGSGCTSAPGGMLGLLGLFGLALIGRRRRR